MMVRYSEQYLKKQMKPTLHQVPSTQPQARIN